MHKRAPDSGLISTPRERYFSDFRLTFLTGDRTALIEIGLRYFGSNQFIFKETVIITGTLVESDRGQFLLGSTGADSA